MGAREDAWVRSMEDVATPLVEGRWLTAPWRVGSLVEQKGSAFPNAG